MITSQQYRERLLRMRPNVYVNGEIVPRDDPRLLCQRSGGCIQRCMGIDSMNALSVVTYEMDQALGTDYNKRFLAYLEYFQTNDLCGNCAQTDVKGDRS